MNDQEMADNAHILEGLTIHNTVDSDGEIGVLLNGVKDGQSPVSILTTLKILEEAVKAINEEIKKEIVTE